MNAEASEATYGEAAGALGDRLVSRGAMSSIIDPVRHPALSRLVELQLRVWPEHEEFLKTRFEHADLEFAEKLSGLIARATDSLEELAVDYRWFCDRMNEEELHFRRTGAYRLST